MRSVAIQVSEVIKETLLLVPSQAKMYPDLAPLGLAEAVTTWVPTVVVPNAPSSVRVISAPASIVATLRAFCSVPIFLDAHLNALLPALK